MKPIAIAPAFVALALVASCTEATPPARSPAAAAILAAPAPSTCPLGVQGARVVYEEMPEGGALVFTAPAEKVEELRDRARNASAMHGPGQKVGMGHDGKHGEGGVHGLRMMQMPPAYAGADDIEGGARIRIYPADASDIDVLRAKLKARAEEMMAVCR